MAFERPPRLVPWFVGMLLLASAGLGAAVAGDGAIGGMIIAAGGAFVLGQRQRPAPSPIFGPFKRRASDFLKIGSDVTVLHRDELPERARRDLAAAQTLLETLRGQIDGVQQDVAEGVTAVVTQVEAINRLSTGQRERIGHSLAGVETMRDVLEVPRAIISQLGEMLAERDRAITENYAGLQSLAREFQELRSALDVISQVADKAFFLAINASLEAHRHGEMGAAFGLIATEMRALATQTADGAREVSASINFFADRMQTQIVAALPTRDGGQRDDVLNLVRDLERAQDDAATVSARLSGLMQVMEAGHSEIVCTLSDMLGRLQFEDVTRQRLEQVGCALGELGKLAVCSYQGAGPSRSVADLLEEQQQNYVMESQRLVHARVASASGTAASAAPKIELF